MTHSFSLDKRLNQYSSNTSASLFHCKDFARLNECKWIYSVLTRFMVIYLKNRQKKLSTVTSLKCGAIKIKSYLFNSQLRSISVNDAVPLWHTRLPGDHIKIWSLTEGKDSIQVLKQSSSLQLFGHFWSWK